MKRLSSGNEALDAIMNGGIPLGDTVLISGHAGSGKTILGLQFLIKGKKQGLKGILLTFEQSPKSIREEIRGLGLPVDGIEIHGFNQKQPSNLIDNIYEKIREVEADIVVIDSISALFALYKPSDIRKALNALLEALSEHKCTVFLIDEIPGYSEQITKFGFEEFLVDDVILLFHTPIGIENRRMLGVLKMRKSPHNEQMHVYQIKQGKGIELESFNGGNGD